MSRQVQPTLPPPRRLRRKIKGRGFDGASLMDVVELVMSDGKCRTIIECRRDAMPLYSKARKASVGTCLANLARSGRIKRIRTGYYQKIAA